ncbi:Uncharacterised protein [Enterobacter kobei]|nr:Uncharacterised protein [Enterobacter kobei]SAF26375.1 Uncharacterised protein [Enterobacter kobei]
MCVKGKGERWGMVLNSPQRLYRVGFQDFIR